MIEIIVVLTTAAVAAWASGARAHRKSSAARALERYARSRGLVFVPPPLPRTSPQVVGEAHETAFVIDLYRLDRMLRTRVSAAIARGTGPSLSIATRGSFTWKEEAAFVLGDAAFDDAYIVTSGAAEDVDALAGIASLLLVLAERRAVWLRASASHVTLSWAGVETDPGPLDAARDIVVAVAGWHRTTMPYR